MILLLHEVEADRPRAITMQKPGSPVDYLGRHREKQALGLGERTILPKPESRLCCHKTAILRKSRQLGQFFWDAA
jgi:hypothetical protein